MKTSTCRARFALNFANKTIVGTKTSFDLAKKGSGPVYAELAKLIKKHPDFGFEVKEPTEPAKNKQTYKGMNVAFILDYCSAVNEPAFRERLEQVRDYLEENKKPVYPTIKREFLEHYAPGEYERFAYGKAKVIVKKYRHNGIITAATSHTEPVEGVSDNADLSPAA